MVASCRSMTPANASRKVVVASYGWYMFMNFFSLTLGVGEMRCPSGAWSSTESNDVGREVISNVPVGTASRSGFIG